MSGTRLDVCLIGAGPRGLSTLERLCAGARHLPAHRAVTVHIVEPYVPGPGRVWRTGQSRHLLMNTVASQVTVFTDGSVEMAGPCEPGPSLYHWARSVAAFGTEDEHGEDFLAEARALGPDSYSTRALYGRYLSWAFQRTVAGAPGNMSLSVHRRLAVALDDDPDGTQTVMLEDGARLTGLHAVVLSQGHVSTQLSPQLEELGDFADEHGLRHLPPANPADVQADLARIGSGEPVLLRGLGLNFFDYMALLTEGRGGTYEREDGHGAQRGGAGEGGVLRYRPSGREPLLLAGSRRGVPYHSRGENEKGAEGRHEPLLLTPELADKLRAGRPVGGGLDFVRDLWPLVAREVEAVYYTTLLAGRGGRDQLDEFRDSFLVCEPGDGREERLLRRFGVRPDERWDWELVQHPYRERRFSGPEDFARWLRAHLRADLTAAREGNVTGPVKAALDVLRDLRNEIRLAVDHGGLDGHSYRDDLDHWYTPLNAYLSIGPPASRVEELLALLDAGVLRIVGPGARAWADRGTGRFLAESPLVPGSRVEARTLIEARLPEVDLPTTADPLLRHLLTTGQCRPYLLPSARGGAYRTGGLAVTDRPYRLLDAAGGPHPRRFAHGVPTESVHWVTAAGIRPGVNSVTLGDSDAIACAVLELSDAGPEPSESPEPSQAPEPLAEPAQTF